MSTAVQPAKRDAEQIDEKNAKKAKTEEAKTQPKLTGSAYDINEHFLKLLLTVKVDAVRPPDNRIFVAQRTDRVVDVFKGLIKHNFLSVPVLQKTKSKYYGFIDIYDIVKFVVNFFGETEELKNSEDFFTLAEKSEEFQKKTVNDIMTYPLSNRNPFHPVSSGYTLFAAIELLARERGLHRVPVVDRDRKLITVITQSQLVQILEKNLDIIGAKKYKPVNMTRQYLEEVFTVSEDMIAMDAFKMMAEKNVSGLAVVNAEGKLTGTLSIRDLKAMSADGRLFWRLYQSIKNFLSKVRAETTSEVRPRHLVTVMETDALETAIKLLAENKVHRVWIVDNQQKPLGVLSLKDVLLEIIEQNPPGA